MHCTYWICARNQYNLFNVGVEIGKNNPLGYGNRIMIV